MKNPFNNVVRKGRYSNKPATKKEPKESALMKNAKKAFTFRNVMLLASLTFFGSRMLKNGFGGGDDDDFISRALKPPKPVAKLVVRRMNDKISEYDAAFLSATKNPKAAIAHKMQYAQLKMLDSEVHIFVCHFICGS